MAFDVSPISVNAFYGHQAARDRLLGGRHRNRRKDKALCDEVTNCRSSAVARWPKEFPSRLLGPTVCWKTFYRQNEAFEFARHFAEDMYIFAFESATDPTLNKGQRKYLATSLPVFWHYYSQLPDTRKSHYEIIPEGWPCKLYFDLEFQREYNASRDGTKMTETFVRFVCSWLKECFDISVDRSNVLDFDASTVNKFSRHLIFQLPGAVFENNVTAGKFVHYIAANLIYYIKKLSGSLAESTSPTDVLFLPEKIVSVTDSLSGTEESTRTYLSSTEMDEHYPTEIHNSSCSSNLSCLCEEGFIQKENNEICSIPDSFSNKDSILNGNSVGPSFTSELLHPDIPCHGHAYSTSSKEENSLVSHVSCSDNSSFPRRTGKEILSLERDISSFCSERSKKILSLFPEEDLKKLLVRKKDGAQTLFCDLGVYTKNRNFRLYLSSKLNKQNPLMIAKENTFKPESEHETLECDIFYASLVSHSRISKGPESVLSFDGQGLGKSIQRTMKETQPKSKSDVISKADTLEGWNCISPYPEVDEFIMSLIASNGHSGSIRHWTYFIQSETVVYDIVGYRWCGNIGRQHKSNNIMYVTDLRQGVYYQKCYDPECQASQYRSPECPLPPYVLPGYYFLDDDDDITLNAEAVATESEDELLISAVEDVELMQVLDGSTPSNSSPNTQDLFKW